MSAVEQAVARFQEGFNCAESVVSTYAPPLGLDRETALKVAGGFGGGMAHMGGTCGAVTGAFMVLGLKHGRTRPDDQASKEETYRLVNEFATRFRARHGSIVCRELLGFDIATREGVAEARRRCPRFIQSSGEILEELL